jgi:hypothetical protein
MPTRRDVVAEQLRALADDLENLWIAVSRDPKKEARRERAWTMFSGALGAAATMASRRLLAKSWPVLTGEQPPTGAAPQPTPRHGEEATEELPAPDAEVKAGV